MATKRTVTSSNTGVNYSGTGTPINTDLGSQVLQKSEVIKSEPASELDKISEDKLFLLWCNDSLEHLTTDQRGRFSNFLREYKDETLDTKDRDWLENKIIKTVYRYFENKTMGNTERELFSQYKYTFIEKIANLIIKDLLKDEQPS